MNTFVEFLPVIAFVVAYWLTDIKTAIAVIMIAMTLQVALTWLIRKTVNRMTLASAVLVVVFGGVSLVLNNALIFKWKPTIFNWVLGLVFLGSQFIGERPLIQRLMASVATEGISLSAADWRNLNLMWVVFFAVSGLANIYVAYNFPENVWVNFKLFGLMGLTFVFVLLQALWMNRRSAEAGAPTNTGGE